MEHIYEPNNSFPFDKLTLAPPTVISGGNYFIKYLVDGASMYIQPPKCQTKQGVSKAGKKYYCDLMFNNENEQFIRWMEDLENYTCKYIFENREKWFETEMELHDIENYFTSPLKLYKSGKFYIARTSAPIRLGKLSLKIYDENECDVDIESIKENTNIITILEVQGIKCSARSFQIELELKQMMVVKPSNLFEKCIIKSQNVPTITDTIANDLEKTEENPEENPEEKLEEKIEEKPEEKIEEQNDTEENITMQEESDNLDEVDVVLDNVSESDILHIKPRSDVQYEMYRIARRKAKMARDLALSAYLEVKHIKNAYMLQNIQDSDESDIDEESLNFEVEDIH